jgi:acyl dehydratase
MDPVRDTDVAGRRAAIFRRVVTQDDFDRFAQLSGDDNPIHVDERFCATTRWGRTLCHGMFLHSLLVHVIRSQLVPGGLELEQELKFPGPIYAGDEITIACTIVRVDPVAGLVEVRSRITREGDGVGCEARTLLCGRV